MSSTSLRVNASALAAATSTFRGRSRAAAAELDTVLAECERLSQQYRDAMALKEVSDQRAPSTPSNSPGCARKTPSSSASSTRRALRAASLASKCEALSRTRDCLTADCARLSRERSQIENDRDRAAAEGERWFAAAIRGPRTSHQLRLHRRAENGFIRSCCAGSTPPIGGSCACAARKRQGFWRIGRATPTMGVGGAVLPRRARSRPRGRAIWVQLGHALKEAGRTADAETAYRKAASFYGASLDTLLSLAHVLTMRREDTEASALYAQALALAPPPRDPGAVAGAPATGRSLRGRQAEGAAEGR